MSHDDQIRWDARYARGEHGGEIPSSLLTRCDPLLPRSGTALDIAGGTGRHAIWLAQRGLDVTLADISPVALSIATQRAADAGVRLHTLAIDFERAAFPAGPWDVILSFHFLCRPLIPAMANALRPGGWLIYVQPTMSNLLRHEKPSARFLLDDGELPRLVVDLEIVHHEEGWLEADRHLAFLIARRSTRSTSSPSSSS
jgi:tellurite methyltransferase